MIEAKLKLSWYTLSILFSSRRPTQSWAAYGLHRPFNPLFIETHESMPWCCEAAEGLSILFSSRHVFVNGDSLSQYMNFQSSFHRDDGVDEKRVRTRSQLSILFSSRPSTTLGAAAVPPISFNPLFIETWAIFRLNYPLNFIFFQSSFHRDLSLPRSGGLTVLLSILFSSRQNRYIHASWTHEGSFNPLFIETCSLLHQNTQQILYFQSSFHRDRGRGRRGFPRSWCFQSSFHRDKWGNKNFPWEQFPFQSSFHRDPLNHSKLQYTSTSFNPLFIETRQYKPARGW